MWLASFSYVITCLWTFPLLSFGVCPLWGIPTASSGVDHFRLPWGSLNYCNIFLTVLEVTAQAYSVAGFSWDFFLSYIWHILYPYTDQRRIGSLVLFSWGHSHLPRGPTVTSWRMLFPNVTALAVRSSIHEAVQWVVEEQVGGSI